MQIFEEGGKYGKPEIYSGFPEIIKESFMESVAR